MRHLSNWILSLLTGVRRNEITLRSKDTRTLVKSVKRLSPKPGDIFCIFLTGQAPTEPNTIQEMTDAVNRALKTAGIREVSLVFIEAGYYLEELYAYMKTIQTKIEHEKKLRAAKLAKEQAAKGVL